MAPATPPALRSDATRNDRLACQALHEFILLIARQASDDGEPAVRSKPGWRDLQRFAFNPRRLARSDPCAAQQMSATGKVSP
jgi:hypothetical protein